MNIDDDYTDAVKQIKELFKFDAYYKVINMMERQADRICTLTASRDTWREKWKALKTKK